MHFVELLGPKFHVGALESGFTATLLVHFDKDGTRGSDNGSSSSTSMSSTGSQLGEELGVHLHGDVGVFAHNEPFSDEMNCFVMTDFCCVDLCHQLESFSDIEGTALTFLCHG